MKSDGAGQEEDSGSLRNSGCKSLEELTNGRPESLTQIFVKIDNWNQKKTKVSFQE